MRLSEKEVATIRKVVSDHDAEARVFLFGSRTDDSRRGGDIDLLLESSRIDFSEKLSILVDLKRALGERKIDIVVTRSVESDPDPFIQSIRESLVAL